MTTKADSKRRVVLPGANPGDIYDVQKQDDGQYLLVRLQRPEPRGAISREESLRAMERNPLRPVMTWEELKGLTREP
ncbi:MAG: hypothetical protein AAF481_09490 [Acidobacteriota bacterium]